MKQDCTADQTVYTGKLSGDTLSVSVIADELNISAAYLSTLFKKETGQTLIKYISWYRIEKAKELLKTTTMKVGDIAEKVGYVNASYLYHCSEIM